MSKNTINLTPEQRKFLESQKGRLSARQLAKHLGVSREDLKKLLEEAPETVSETPDGKKTAWFILGIILLTFIAFSSALGNQFTWDAQDDITGDPTLGVPSHFFQTISKPLGYFNPEKPKVSLWRPTASATFFTDALFWGKKPFGFALTSILLHIIVSVLLFFVLRRFLKPDWLCFVATMVYAVHPVHSEAVAYIPSRGDVLCGLFVLLALLFYRRVAVVSWAAFLLALYSKETGVVVLGLLPAYDWLVAGETKLDFNKLLRRYTPYALCVILYLVTRFYALGGLGQMIEGEVTGGQYQWQSRLWIQPVYFMNYFQMIFIPVGLHTWRQIYFPKSLSDPVYLFSLFLLAAFFVAVFFGFKKNKTVLFGFIWFILFLVPVLNIFMLLNRPVLEHWLYIPLMGFSLFFFLLIKIVLLKDNLNKRIFLGCAVVVISALMFLTFYQNQTWKDEIVLWEHTTRYVKEDALPYYNLGVAYLEKGEMDKAESLFIKTLEINPNFEEARYNLDVMKHKRTGSA